MVLLCVAAISKEDPDHSNRGAKLPFNGYSDEFLDRLEPNGNIPNDKDCRYGKFEPRLRGAERSRAESGAEPLPMCG